MNDDSQSESLWIYWVLLIVGNVSLPDTKGLKFLARKRIVKPISVFQLENKKQKSI